MLTYYIIAAVLIIIDQLTKWGILQNFELYDEKILIPSVFSLYYIQNPGAAWGIFAGRMTFFYIITVLVIGYLIYNFHKYKIESKLARLSFSFILAGAIGNFIDRLAYGYVVDMFRLDFINFPIFNVADVCLTIGVGLMIIYVLFFEKDENEVKEKE